MPFALPETFKQKVLSPNTQKVYKSKLNALAKRGYDTPSLLMTKTKEVIAAIEEIGGGDRQKKRCILAAIFWILPNIPVNNDYHTYWQTVLPTEVSGTDKPWVPK